MTDYKYEIYRERSHHLNIEVKNGELETVDAATEESTSARVIKDNKLGFAYSTEPGCSEENLINQALELAKVSESDPDYLFAEGLKEDLSEKCFANLDSISREEKIGLAIELERSARAADKRILNVRRPSYAEVLKEVSIKNSEGLNVKFKNGCSTIRITAMAISGSESEWSYDEDYSFDPSTLDPKDVGNRAGTEAAMLLGARKISSGKWPVVLDRRVVGQLLTLLSNSFMADAVYKGRSILADKAGKRVYSKNLSIVNDPSLKSGFGFAPFDGEGVRTSRQILVEDGFVKGFVSDLYHTKKIKNAFAGSSFRGSGILPPKISVKNVYIESGKGGLNDMIKGVNEGLLVTDLLGTHTANTVTGDFSVGASGFWIKDGVTGYPIKGITIAGNLHDVFGKVLKVGGDLKFYGSVGAPSLLIEEIAVSGN